MQTKTLSICGVSIVVRKPTEAEVVALEAKKTRAQELDLQPEDEAPRDYTDDGDNELVALVVQPDAAAVMSLLEEAPLATVPIERAVRELGREGAKFIAAPDLVKAQRDADEAKGGEAGFYLGLRLDRGLEAPVPILLRKIGRIESKMLRREHKRKIPPPKALVQLVKDHLIGPAPDWVEMPFLSLELGYELYKAACGDGERSAGK